MKHKTIKVEPLRDDTLTITVGKAVIRRRSALGQRAHGNKKGYNRKAFKDFDEC